MTGNPGALVHVIARTIADHATMFTRDQSWYCGGCPTRLGAVTVDPFDDTTNIRPSQLLADHQAVLVVETITNHTTQKEH